MTHPAFARSIVRLAIAVAMLASAALASPASAQKRVALVVGNNSYSNLPADRQLRNAVNDAQLMRNTLQGLGFDVIYGENLDRRSLIDRLFDLTARIGPNDVALFFFAGHGVSFSGANYLLPSDVPAPRATGRSEEGRLAEQALAETIVIDRLTASGARVSIVVLDACRDNPLQGSDRRSVGIARGLAQGQPARGVFSIYSAGFGQTALDRLGPDDSSPNSVFTRVFADKLRTPGLDLRAIATQTRAAVVGMTQKIGHDQFPAYYDQIIGDDIVFASAESAAPNAARDDQVRQVWSTIQNTGSVAVLEDFIRQFGTTAFGSLARARLDEVRKSQSAAVSPSPPPAAEKAPAPPAAPTVKMDARAARESVTRNFAFFGDILTRTKSNYVDVPDEAVMMRAAIEAMRKAYPKAEIVASASNPAPGSARNDSISSEAVLAAASQILVAGAPADAETQLFSVAVNGMLAGLDPHSSYMDGKSYRDLQVQTRGEFGGLGIEVTMEDGLVKVVSPIDDTPAAKAGIQANDIITHIDDQPVQGLTLSQAVEKMRGPVNTKIKLRVTRAGQDKPVEISITRDIIRVRAVRSNMQGDDVAYIKLTQFNQLALEGLTKAIAELTARVPADKLKGFIIDLRNNPGGLLDQAISVSDAFLDRGEIVSVRGRKSEETQRFNARSGDLTKGKPVIVLINGGSASASEIVAGALQDHKRGTVLGSRSFGKGSVQTIIPLGSNAGNGALRLTTARYYTPSGKSIQAKGISPDIEVLQDVPEELKARAGIKSEASLPGHLKAADGEEQTGSQSYIPPNPKDDKALNMAADLLRGTITHAAFPPSGKRAIAR